MRQIIPNFSDTYKEEIAILVSIGTKFEFNLAVSILPFNDIIASRSILPQLHNPWHTNITSYSMLLSSRTRLLTTGHTNLNQTETI